MFYCGRPMSTARADVNAVVADLQARWGAAAPRVVGSLALAPAATAAAAEPATLEAIPEIRPRPELGREPDRVIPTGFAALDAILGPGGLPRSASVAIRGDGSSGRTTLVHRLAATAQTAGSIVAWLDLSNSFDPVEAVSRGIRLEWLVVVTPATLDEGLAIAGALLAGRSVDLLVIDLPARSTSPTDKPGRIADRLARLAALARRAETLLVVLEPPGLSGGLATAVAESTGLRLELARRSWIRLGRDVVGQRTEALIARNRYGPPGRRATLRILYAEGGDRDACLRREDLLSDQAPAIQPERTHDATSPPPPPASPHRARPGASLQTLAVLPDRPAHPGRAAVGSGLGRRRQPGSPGVRRPAGDAARDRASAHA